LRYLVTGGSGFIGSHLVDALVARGDEAIVLDDFSTGTRGNLQHLEGGASLDLRQGSVLDADLVEASMAEVDVCIHLAAAVGVHRVVERPLDSLQRNVRGTDTVVSIAAAMDRRLLITSSSEVYGRGSGEAVNENADSLLGSPAKARWAYAVAKSYGEALVHAYRRETGLPMTVVRLFNTVGPRQRPDFGMVLPSFVASALERTDLVVYGNGTQERCFLHVSDSVRALLLLLDTELSIGGVYNIGSSTSMPIVELARRVIERTGSTSKLRLVPLRRARERDYEEPGCRRPDTTALRTLTGWTPRRTVDDAIADVIAYQRAVASTSGAAIAG
jgi:UDP-glucose 4-epimerase